MGLTSKVPDNYKGSNNSNATDGQYYISQIDEPLKNGTVNNDKQQFVVNQLIAEMQNLLKQK